MEDLGKVMVVPKGAYNANTTYEILDLVTYNGSSYVALKSTKGNVPTNTAYWQLHGQGYPGSAAGVPAKDTQGMVVTAGNNSTVQALIDAIADRVMTKLFAKTDIAQTESTSTTKVPSSAYFKQVVDAQNSNLSATAELISIKNIGIRFGSIAINQVANGTAAVTMDLSSIFNNILSATGTARTTIPGDKNTGVTVDGTKITFYLYNSTNTTGAISVLYTVIGTLK